MRLRQRWAATGLLALSLLLYGTLGYVLLEGWSLGDALYMTVITITTVGYREVGPLDASGKLFTSSLILLGVGAFFYTFTTLVQTVVEGELAQALGRRRLEERIAHLKDHFILCGYGRVGEEIARDFQERGVDFVVLDADAARVEQARAAGFLAFQGDATEDAALEATRVRQARGLIAAVETDAANTYITLAARSLNPDLRIIARTDHPASAPKLRQAGADRVISPYAIGGRRMALLALQPMLVDFLETLIGGPGRDQLLAELEVTSGSGLADRTLAEACPQGTQVTVLGILHADGQVLAGPPQDVRLGPGDRLIVLGAEAEVERLARAASAGHPA